MRSTATILFHARQQSHLWHLNAPNYATHVSLQNFYTEVLELTDKLLEVYMGKGRKIEFSQIRMTFTDFSKEKMFAYFKKLANYVNRTKRSMKPNDGDLVAVMDEILGLINRTQYLLKLA